MSCTSVENWSLTRTIALLAAVFAITIGALLPFAAMAAAQPGQPIVFCTSEGLQTIHSAGEDGTAKQGIGAKCAACVMPLQHALPPSPLYVFTPPRLDMATVHYAPFRVAAPPPARAPPRPPSTAPPLA